VYCGSGQRGCEFDAQLRCWSFVGATRRDGEEGAAPSRDERRDDVVWMEGTNENENKNKNQNEGFGDLWRAKGRDCGPRRT
jgi:hypothetical protein